MKTQKQIECPACGEEFQSSAEGSLVIEVGMVNVVRCPKCMAKEERRYSPACVPEKPILFSGEMVRAILEGRKTQTRRIVIQFKNVSQKATKA